jgi:hypothetical protein
VSPLYLILILTSKFFSFLNDTVVNHLLFELPKYKALAKDFVYSSAKIKVKNEELFNFWKKNKIELP